MASRFIFYKSMQRISKHYTDRLALHNETEGLNLEDLDGVTVRENAKNGDPNHGYHVRARIVVVMVAGIIIGLCYLVMHQLSEAFVHLSVQMSTGKSRKTLGSAILRSVCISLVMAVPASLLVFYEPAAGGPGMPELMSYLNGSKPKADIRFRVMVIKLIGITAIVASGLKSGYDGPFAHFGLITAVLIWKKTNSAVKHRGRFWQKTDTDVLPETHNDALLFGAAGAAAGVAAAFSAPLGGVLFALEEAMSFFHPSLIFQTLCCAIFAFLAKGIPHLLISHESGFSMDGLSWLELGAHCDFPFPLFHLITFSLFGAFFGFAGFAFNWIVIRVVRFKKKYLFPRPYLRLLEVAVMCVLTSVANHGIPKAFDSCIPYTRMFNHMPVVADLCPITCEDTTSLFRENAACRYSICLPDLVREEFNHNLSPIITEAREQCEVDEAFTLKINATAVYQFYEPEEFIIHDKSDRCFYPLRTLFGTEPSHTLDVLFSRGKYGIFSATELAIFGGTYFVLALMTYYIMLPCDLVVPSLIIGGVMGRLIGMGVNAILLPMGILPTDPGAFAILGAMTFWASSSHMAIAIAIIAIESSQDLNILPAIMVCIMVSQLVSRRLGASFYHQEIHELGYPFLDHKPPKHLYKTNAGAIMIKDCKCVTENETASDLRAMLDSNAYKAFPVIGAGFSSDQKMESDSLALIKSGKKVVGLVYRKQLENAMSHIYGKKDVESKSIYSNEPVNIRDFMISPPITVHPEMIGSKAFRVFRRLGLKHLIVVNDDSHLMGMISRAEFSDHEHGHH
eukprot:Partr_v1_DN28063_c0_g1_i2_m57260 putative chloride channel